MKRLEKRSEEVSSKMNGIISLLEENRTLLDAYLYTSRVRCGRVNCKCMSSDYRHESPCLSFKEDGRSRTKTVPEEFVDEFEALTGGYKELRALRKELAKQFTSLLGDLDREIASAAKKGRKRLAVVARMKGGRK